MTRGQRYLDRLYREYPLVWRREKARADKLGVTLQFMVESRANHWALMLKAHGPLREVGADASAGV